MANNDDTYTTRKDLNEFTKNLIDQLNDVFNYTFHRFDDLEDKLVNIQTRLVNVENQLHMMKTDVSSVKKDTTIIPNIFEMLETDGEDIAQIKSRVADLEKGKTV
ncbi:MAG: hypothetical protein F4X71_00910 [Cenarchaeum sp. SB0662_bin_33]|nr:hypothetical protein [Cenarchaeum sp. SB0662_bin_33]